MVACTVNTVITNQAQRLGIAEPFTPPRDGRPVSCSDWLGRALLPSPEGPPRPCVQPGDRQVLLLSAWAAQRWILPFSFRLMSPDVFHSFVR